MADRVGGGFKYKNLQYIFHRVPLVTMAGQAHGLALDEGDNLIVAETLEDLAQAIAAAPPSAGTSAESDGRVRAKMTAAA